MYDRQTYGGSGVVVGLSVGVVEKTVVELLDVEDSELVEDAEVVMVTVDVETDDGTVVGTVVGDGEVETMFGQFMTLTISATVVAESDHTTTFSP